MTEKAYSILFSWLHATTLNPQHDHGRKTLALQNVGGHVGLLKKMCSYNLVEPVTKGLSSARLLGQLSLLALLFYCPCITVIVQWHQIPVTKSVSDSKAVQSHHTLKVPLSSVPVCRCRSLLPALFRSLFFKSTILHFCTDIEPNSLFNNQREWLMNTSKTWERCRPDFRLVVKTLATWVFFVFDSALII